MKFDPYLILFVMLWQTIERTDFFNYSIRLVSIDYYCQIVRNSRVDQLSFMIIWKLKCFNRVAFSWPSRARICFLSLSFLFRECDSSYPREIGGNGIYTIRINAPFFVNDSHSSDSVRWEREYDNSANTGDCIFPGNFASPISTKLYECLLKNQLNGARVVKRAGIRVNGLKFLIEQCG